MGFLSKLWKKLTGWLKPKTPTQGFMVEKSGTNHPIPVIYGHFPKAPCSKVLKVTTDKAGGAINEYLHLVCIICEGEVEELGTVYFNGIPESQIDRERFDVFRYTGKDNQGVSSPLLADFPSWRSTSKLSGLAYLYVRLRTNKEGDWWQGEPTITVDVKGRKVLDPRDGAIKYSNNPALCVYDYATNERFGKGLSPDKLDLEQLKSEANFNETTRTYTRTRWREHYDSEFGRWVREPDGTENVTVTENIFSCNVRLDTGKEVKENLEILLSGMRAIFPEDAGKYRLSIERDQAPVYTFTPDQIVGAIDTDGGHQNNRYNQVIIKYRNHLTGEMDEATYPSESAIHDALLAEDNNKKLVGEFTFDTINNKAEALQMGHVVLYRSREQISARFTGTPETIVVEVGDVVELPSKVLGWSGKPMRVEYTEYDPKTGEVSFQGIEHQNSIYPWAIGDVEEEYADTSHLLPQSIEPPKGVKFEATPESNQSQGRIVWDDPKNALVTGHRVEIKLVDDGSLVYSDTTRDEFLSLPDLSAGNYRAYVYAFNSLFQSAPTLVVFTVELPNVPSTLGLLAGDFEIRARPQVTPANYFTLYELFISDEDNFAGASRVGISGAFSIGARKPDTTYYVWGRTVTPFGVSEYLKQSIKTTNDNTWLVDFLNGSIGPQSFTEEVNDLLGRVDEITGDFEFPDQRQTIIDVISTVYDNFQTGNDLLEEEHTRITQNKLLTAEVDGAKAEIENTKQVVADNQQAVATEISRMSAAVSGVESSITNLSQTVSDLDSSTATQVNQLNSRYNQVNSSITTLQQTVASNQQALSQDITQLTSNINNVNAELTTTKQTVVTNHESLSQLITQLETTVDNNKSLIETLSTTGTTSDEAVALLLETMRTEIDDTFATIVNLNQVKTTADGAAEAITGFRNAVANADDQAATELALSSAITDLGEIKARAFLGLNINGRVTGIYIDGSETESKIDLSSDAINFVNPNTGQKDMEYDAANSQIIFRGKLLAENIEGDVVDAKVYQTTSQIYENQTGWRDLFTIRVEASPFIRRLYVPSFLVATGAGVPFSVSIRDTANNRLDSSILQNGDGYSRVPSPALSIQVPKNVSRTYKVSILVNIPSTLIVHNQDVLVQLFKEGSALS